MPEELNNDQTENTDTKPDTENTNQAENTDQSKEEEFKDDNKEPEVFDFGFLNDDTEDKPKKDSETEDTDSTDTEDKPVVKTSDSRIDKIADHFVDVAIKDGVRDFIAANPEAKTFQSKIERYVNSPARKKFIKQGLPVTAVIAEALMPHMQRLGALKAKQADAEANQTKDGGRTSKAKAPAAADYSKMSNADILKKARQVQNGIN